MQYKRGFILIVLAACMALAPLGCSEKKKSEADPAIVEINDAQILLKDFEREVTTAAHRDPTLRLTEGSLETLLESMIDRKVLIQEAMRLGLSENERFLETIKAYWEQTLIRELIDKKTAEWAGKTFVTEDEVQRHYHLLGVQVTVTTAEADTAEDAEHKRLSLAEGGRPEGTTTIGPLGAGDIPRSSPLFAAFMMEEGDSRVLKSGDGYTVVLVSRKKKADVPPFSELEAKIKARLLEEKKQQALDDWLEELKASSSIKINTELLKGMTNE